MPIEERQPFYNEVANARSLRDPGVPTDGRRLPVRHLPLAACFVLLLTIVRNGVPVEVC